ncbi:MAG: aldolase/citrate lyase family protein [Colwellia polaris]|jgi:2-keto-3-deoxy-L-rhamnonate aldolase RhmA|uniref:HpcH/HpaI aldolase family protein n=1 Tax=Colwellia polaris TaxID=326537 RepID=UPI000A177CEA|nr:aldolase/citrate lyase family protein [Colwellia polaris]|tara:strand:- start:370 stop:1140 length:771 start_codon:yes stop_codon:yes gene_type:complete
MNLKQALATKKPLLGTFIKTPHFHNTEVLAHTNLDVLCLDAEHAPFDRADLDTCVLAAKSKQKPVIIRIPDSENATILNALDLGADGVVIPHVLNAEHAKRIVKKCFYGPDGRGYAGSTRFAGYTTHKLPDNLAANKNETCVIAQIEDLEAIDDIDAICQVEGIDCIFIGRMDLTVALQQTDPSHPDVIAAVEKVVAATKKYNKNCGMFVGNLAELPLWIKSGVSLFLLGSDHSFLLNGANQLQQSFESSIAKSAE